MPLPCDETVTLASLAHDVRTMQALLERMARRQRTQTTLLFQVWLGLGVVVLYVLWPLLL
jgi:hypothetical protein